ncbi:PREDICTED: mitotic spindle assembly checkpoint protein MAD2B [Rhagoletis zephyria]|uniref:mitotic spindle assembly checkpoint protein MAD2B n=1 Tax=Rhagoletis zephyria TaxID=28612 RepID=UPI0008113FC1|nr:PREDICTED: mitotic spindle assembly checkpoint protein MAD2B [Rhagoletis zephyria]
MNSEDLTDILIEALEVFVNHIIYVRGVYPEQIFKKRRVYNVPVYVSIFPSLNSYILNVLKAARSLQQQGELECVLLQFYHDEIPLNECYKFDIKQLQQFIEFPEREEAELPMLHDRFLIDFEQELRSSLYKLAERLKPLEKLPKGAKFKVSLNTTQEAFVKFSHNPYYQDFPWLCDRLKLEQEKRVISLLPLTHLYSIGLILNLEIF